MRCWRSGCSAGSAAFYYSAFSFSLDATLQIFKWVPTRLQTAWRSLKIATDIIAIPGTVMPAGSGVSCLSLKHIVKDVEKAAALILQSARAPTACTLSRHTSSSPLFTWIDFVFSSQIKESINCLCQLGSAAKDKLISSLLRTRLLLSKAVPMNFYNLQF